MSENNDTHAQERAIAAAVFIRILILTAATVLTPK